MSLKVVRQSSVEFVVLQDKDLGMRTQGLVFTRGRDVEEEEAQQVLRQVANVATLPGIVGPSLAMPDMHWGYGFPIGGVAALDYKQGVISPGGVGYDINCGVRLLKTPLSKEIWPQQGEKIMKALYKKVPSGVGVSGTVKVSSEEVRAVLKSGAQWAIKKGYGFPEDREAIEERGEMKQANPDKVSKEAVERGKDQLGTLGAGNHFLEVQVVEKIFLPEIASLFGLFEKQIVVMIHTGSRGLGYQVCSDYLKIMNEAMEKYKIVIPDRQLACVPIQSPEGKNYLGAMAAAANFAFANRQIISHFVRICFQEVLGLPLEEIELLYDVCHNIAKVEEHLVAGEKRKLLVHRKGATRAFPPHHPELPEKYQETGQPVLIPGDMGRCSYVLVGTPAAMEKSFGSTCHGAGRLMSRAKARKAVKSQELLRELKEEGILVFAHTPKLVSEVAPAAYKDVNEVVAICEEAGLSQAVARLSPVGCVKG